MLGNPLVKPTSRFKLLAAIDADAYAAGTYTSGWIDMSLWESLTAMIAPGDLGTNATVDAKLQQATSSAGAGAKDITGKAITQLTQAGTDKSNKQDWINLKSEDLDRDNDFRYVQLSVTIATATSDLAAYVFGLDPRYTGTANASVNEIIG